MSDLVKRLRSMANDYDVAYRGLSKDIDAAADRIEELERDANRYRRLCERVEEGDLLLAVSGDAPAWQDLHHRDEIDSEIDTERLIDSISPMLCEMPPRR